MAGGLSPRGPARTLKLHTRAGWIAFRTAEVSRIWSAPLEDHSSEHGVGTVVRFFDGTEHTVFGVGIHELYDLIFTEPLDPFLSTMAESVMSAPMDQEAAPEGKR